MVIQFIKTSSSYDIKLPILEKQSDLIGLKEGSEYMYEYIQDSTTRKQIITIKVSKI